MLVILLIYSYKKIFKGSHSVLLRERIKNCALKLRYILPFFLLSNTSPDNAIIKVVNISFNIINKNKNIGFIDIEKRDTEYTTTYILDSNVNTKLIFNFNATGKEKSIYRADTLIYSSIFRKLNKKIKLNQSLELVDGKYILMEKNKEKPLHMDIINRNLVTLFFFEPFGIEQVYCDKYKKMIRITPVGPGKYKVVFPNKSSNIYHYEKGQCTMIEVAGPFYKVKLALKSNKQFKNT